MNDTQAGSARDHSSTRAERLSREQCGGSVKVIALGGMFLSRHDLIFYNSNPDPVWLSFMDDDSDPSGVQLQIEIQKQEAKVALNKNINIIDMDQSRTAAISEHRIGGS